MPFRQAADIISAICADNIDVNRNICDVVILSPDSGSQCQTHQQTESDERRLQLLHSAPELPELQALPSRSLWLHTSLRYVPRSQPRHGPSGAKG